MHSLVGYEHMYPPFLGVWLEKVHVDNEVKFVFDNQLNKGNM